MAEIYLWCQGNTTTTHKISETKPSFHVQQRTAEKV